MFHFSLRMAIDTPGHSHRCNSGNPIHRLDRTVAFLAGEARFYVSLVREVHEVGDIVHLDPGDRLTIFPIRGQFHDLRTFPHARYGLVTSHALADARHTGNGRFVRIDVAVLARNLIVRGMYRMAERDRLNRTAIGEKLAVYPCACKQSEHKQ